MVKIKIAELKIETVANNTKKDILIAKYEALVGMILSIEKFGTIEDKEWLVKSLLK